MILIACYMITFLEYNLEDRKCFFNKNNNKFI